MALATVIAGVVVGAGVAVYEGGCYFTFVRVDDEKTIRGIVDNWAADADPEYLRVTRVDDEDFLLIAKAHDDNGKAIAWDTFKVKDLYVEDGVLKHSDWGTNTQIGRVSMITGVAPDK